MKQCQLLGNRLEKPEDQGCIIWGFNGFIKINFSLIGTDKLCKVLLAGAGNYGIAIELIGKLEIRRDNRLSVIPKGITSKNVGERFMIIR